MHDVVHPSNGNRPANLPAGQAGPAGKSKPHIVRLVWKLPARLRRPIQRKPVPKPMAKPHTNVRFERRPLTTKAIAGQHTSDVHLGTAPKIKVAPPPYVGQAAKARPVIRKRQVPVIPVVPAPEPTSPVSVSVWLDNKQPEKIFKKKIPMANFLM